MGFRMSIWPEGSPEELVGNDHKLYCYTDWKNVSLSFRYLFIKALSKKEEFKFCLRSPNTEKDAYGLLCHLSTTGDLTLSEDEFKEFAELYLQNFIMTYPERIEDYIRICDYMYRMCKTPGNKILNWG